MAQLYTVPLDDENANWRKSNTAPLRSEGRLWGVLETVGSSGVAATHSPLLGRSFFLPKAMHSSPGG